MYVISECKRANPETVGTKAWHLFQLNKHFLVPKFSVITVQGFKDYQKVKNIVPKLEYELRNELGYFLRKGRVALRSSGTAEDLRGISFAGMYTTVLNIKDVDEGLEAVMRVWDSIDSQRVKKYCEQMNVPRGNMAVIIQHQLKPQVSGVMVTQSPFSVSEVLIECCYGLGDKLVSGEITPTRYRLGHKEMIEHRGDDLLSNKQLFELVEAGKKIEKIFGSPQDIEWAIEGGKIFILQSRPVVVHACAPRRKGTVWCNANVRETIPDPMSPMGWSIFDEVFFPAIIIGAFGLPITIQQYKKYRPVELISGRLYWNINNTIAFGKSVGPILDFIEGDRSVDPQLRQAFRAVDVQDLPTPISSLTMKWFSVVAFIRLVHYLILGFSRFRWMSKKVMKAHDALETVCEKLVPSNDLRKGSENIQKWMALITEKFARRYFGGLFLSVFYLILLSKLLSIRMCRKGAIIARKTVVGVIDRTGEMALALKDLAAIARQKIKRMTVSHLEALYARDAHFRDCFDSFIHNFGHRGPAEFDIASPNWREDHDMVYRIITTTREDKGYHVDRKTILNEIMKNVGAYERFILKIFLPRIEAFMPLRENGKDSYLKVMAKLKDQLLYLEKNLIAKGYIKETRDIFFLTLDDLENIAADRFGRKDLLELIRKRKMEWKISRQIEAPDIVYESGARVYEQVTKTQILLGEPLSFGRVKARARVVSDFADSIRLKEGEILVTHHTDPGWTPLFTIAKGVIIEAGGIICHAAMVARELGVPAVVIRGATKLIGDGQMVELDAEEGKVRLMSND